MEHIISKEKLDMAIKRAIKVVDHYMDKFSLAYPALGKGALQNIELEKNEYRVSENNSWITGFWSGLLWLCYELTGDEKYKELGLVHVKSFKLRIEKELYLNHHDLGFLYSPSCVAAYKLTGDAEAREAAIMAADYLIARFVEKGQFIKAWGPIGELEPKAYFYIIDCLLNVPLLYWATEETGDNKYREIAEKHLQTTMDTIIRPDNTTSHKFLFDFDTGAPIKGCTKQGFSDDSCWSRGQAWGVAGFALNYGATKNPQALESFKRVADYFSTHLPEDNIPYWDFVFTEGDEPRDSSAAAIFVCGVLEMSKYLPADDADLVRFKEAATKILNSLIDNYSSDGGDGKDGLIRHVTGSKPSGVSVDSVDIYADYFYLEALLRCAKDWNSYWC